MYLRENTVLNVEKMELPNRGDFHKSMQKYIIMVDDCVELQ